MTGNRSKTPGPCAWTRWSDAAFLGVSSLLCLACIGLIVDPRFIYNTGGLITDLPSLYYGRDFFIEHLVRPAGLAQYLAALVAQAYYHRWLGACAVVALGLTLYTLSGRYLARLSIRPWRIVGLLGVLVLLAVHLQYLYRLDLIVAIIMALGCTELILQVGPRQAPARIAACCLSSAALYWAAGGTGLLFSTLCGLALLAQGMRPGWALATIIAGAAMPYLIGALAYGDTVAHAYARLTPVTTRGNQGPAWINIGLWLLYASLPAASAWAILWRRYMSGPNSGRSARPYSIRLWEAVVGLAAISAVVWYAYDPRLRGLFAADYHAKAGQWEKVIQIARNLPYNYLVCHAANRAMFHTGRLGDEMFTIPQDPAALMLTARPAFWHKADTCMELGLVNEAENALCIAMEIYGERPVLVQRLAIINLAKGNIPAAQVLLGTLTRCPFWIKWARNKLSAIRQDPSLSGDEQVQHLRKAMLHRDWVRPRPALVELLEQDPTNRMAYEYRMAELLLAKDLAALIRTFNRYHHQNMTRIPRYYQQALLLAKALGIGDADLGGLKIEPGVLEEMATFLRAMASFGTDLKRASRELEGPFGTTYFYYFYLGGPR